MRSAPDQGQSSKLLGRLKCVGLIENNGRGQAKGEPTPWRLTDKGAKVEQVQPYHQRA
jgi:chromosome segregation and condensation protein ScpB